MSKGKTKFYTRKKVIQDVEYTAQFSGLSSYFRMLDDSHVDSGSYVSNEKLVNNLLKNIIVDPKVTADDFDDLDTLNEVVDFAREVAQGKFREEAIESTEREKGA